tara:strand:+ start:328 stop:945 length:618 start_codon:yes stop_codon:yes gene_type:complete
LIKLFISGGIVMWPLLVLSIITLACIFERLLFWINLKKENNKVKNYILENYEDEKNSNIFIGKLKSKSQNPYAKLTIEILNYKSKNLQEFNDSIDSFLSNIENNLNKYGNIFGLTINISPLLGLLGTVLGLMNSFAFIDIGSVGTNAKEVTGGISAALVSTAYGLIIAIITVVFLSYFNICRNNEMFQVEEFSYKLRAFYFKNLR